MLHGAHTLKYRHEPKEIYDFVRALYCFNHVGDDTLEDIIIKDDRFYDEKVFRLHEDKKYFVKNATPQDIEHFKGGNLVLKDGLEYGIGKFGNGAQWVARRIEGLTCLLCDTLYGHDFYEEKTEQGRYFSQCLYKGNGVLFKKATGHEYEHRWDTLYEDLHMFQFACKGCCDDIYLYLWRDTDGNIDLARSLSVCYQLKRAVSVFNKRRRDAKETQTL